MVLVISPSVFHLSPPLPKRLPRHLVFISFCIQPFSRPHQQLATPANDTSMPHSVAHSVASTADASSVSPSPLYEVLPWLANSYSSRRTSVTGSSPALTSFEKAHPLDGPPSEWLYAGTSRRSDLKEVKDRIVGWDKEWANLAGEVGKE